jgi:hypothetical protein
LEFTLPSFATASDEQYESIPNDEVALLLSKIQDLQKFCKERRRTPTGSYVCSDNIHFIIDCPKWKKLDSYNKYNCTNQKNSSNKGDDKKKHRFRVRRRRSSRRSCPRCVLPWATLTSPVMTPPAQKKMRS